MAILPPHSGVGYSIANWYDNTIAKNSKYSTAFMIAIAIKVILLKIFLLCTRNFIQVTALNQVSIQCSSIQ